MKFDFHNDRRLMQAAPSAGANTAGNPLEKNLEAARNAFNKALLRGEAGKADALKALNEANLLLRQSGILGVKNETDAAMAQLARTLKEEQSKNTANVGVQAAQGVLDLEKNRNTADLDMLKMEQNSVFNAKMIIPNMQLSFYGMLKMGGEILGLCGIDTKEFCAKMDKRIDEIEFPSVNRDRIASAKTNISTGNAESKISETADNAVDLANATPAQLQSVFDAMMRDAGAKSTGPAPAQGLKVQTASTSVAKLIEDHTLTAPEGRQVLASLMAEAAKGGDKTVLETGEAKNFTNTVDQLLHRAASAANAQKVDKVKVELGLPALTPSGP